ncbi:MAG TPA: hypothetical protein VLI06_18520 [Solimonas sp.]|nr:hypothetical protein [Solimonas sp.]
MRKPALLFTAFVLMLFLLPAWAAGLRAAAPAPLVGVEPDLALPEQAQPEVQPLWLQQDSAPRPMAL